MYQKLGLEPGPSVVPAGEKDAMMNFPGKALECAWDAGVTLYDTCDSYGNGHSEELIGNFLKGKRDQAVIVTKGGTNFRLPERSKNFTRDYLVMCLGESLKRLQTVMWMCICFMCGCCGRKRGSFRDVKLLKKIRKSPFLRHCHVGSGRHAARL